MRFINKKDNKIIVLVKHNSSKKYKVQLRFYKLQEDGVTELTSKLATALGRTLTKHGYIKIENIFKEEIDYANSAFWILRDYVNTTGSDKEILKWSRFYMEV